VVEAFIDCFGGTVLREVDALFEDLGFGFDSAAEEAAQQRVRGARRSRAAGYVASADLSQPREADRLLEAIALSLADWESQEGDQESSAFHGLAELRNKLGDAHGTRRGGHRAQPRHARMAAGAAMTVATFLIETLEERRARPERS
jgi:hypothetical protein